MESRWVRSPILTRAMGSCLCIYADSHEDIAPTTEQRVGLNIVHWASRRAFMLVGRKAMPELRDLASLFSAADTVNANSDAICLS